jgi:hypothetical protein
VPSWAVLQKYDAHLVMAVCDEELVDDFLRSKEILGALQMPYIYVRILEICRYVG